MKRIVCMVSGDLSDAGALSVARTLGARTGAGVTLLHVVGEDEPEPTGVQIRGVDQLQEVGEVVEVAAAVLARLDADLLVLGRGMEGAPDRGQHGRALLRASGCPVLIVPEGGPLTVSTAVVGMDLSPSAFEALSWARTIAVDVTSLAVVTVEGVAPAALRQQFAVAAAERGLAGACLELAPGGSPAECLIERSGSFDLVCVGSRGLGPLAAAVLGSTAERVAARSSCPVLVVRHRGESRGLLGALFG